MGLTRRGFLKASGAGVLSATVFGSIAGAIAESVESSFAFGKFNPLKEYGDYVLINERIENRKQAEPILKILTESLKKHIPRKYFCNVQFRKKEVDYGRATAICWHYSPKHKKGKTWLI